MVVQLVLFGVYVNPLGDKIVITRLTEEKVDFKTSSSGIITESWDVSLEELQDLFSNDSYHLSGLLWQDI